MPVPAWIRSRLRRLAPCAVVLALVSAAVATLATLTAAPAGADATHQAVIGMPFTGKWAYNVPTTASCGPANSQTSHPSCHMTNPSTGYLWGDWATDVYAAEGTAVKLEVPYATGALS